MRFKERMETEGPKKTNAVEAPKEVPDEAKIIYSADSKKRSSAV